MSSPSGGRPPLRPAIASSPFGEPLLSTANAPQVHMHAGLLSLFSKKKMLLFAHPVSASVPKFSAHAGKVPYVLHRSPLISKISFDLHVLGMRQRFILSQDQLSI